MLLEHALIKNPDELQLTLNLIGAKCQSGTLTSSDLNHAAAALRQAPNTGAPRLRLVRGRRTRHRAKRKLSRLVESGGVRPPARGSRRKYTNRENSGDVSKDRLHLQGRIALLATRRRRATAPLELFNAALDADTRPWCSSGARRRFLRRPAIRLARPGVTSIHLALVWLLRPGPDGRCPHFTNGCCGKKATGTTKLPHPCENCWAKDIAEAACGFPKICSGTAGDMISRYFWPWILLALMLVLTVAMYWPSYYWRDSCSTTDSYVDSPDIHVTTRNLGDWIKAALCRKPEPISFRALSMVSFAANLLVFTGLDPFWLKLTNIGIHLLNGGVLLFLMLREMCSGYGRSLGDRSGEIRQAHPISIWSPQH